MKLLITTTKNHLPQARTLEENYMGVMVTYFETPLIPFLNQEQVNYEAAYHYMQLREEFAQCVKMLENATVIPEELPNFTISYGTAEYLLPLLLEGTFPSSTSDIHYIFTQRLEHCLRDIKE